jgi:hypothetical protein
MSPQNITTGPHGHFEAVNGLRDYLLHTWRSHTLGEIAEACQVSVATIADLKTGARNYIHKDNADRIMAGLAQLARYDRWMTKEVDTTT